VIDRASFAAAWRELGASGDAADLHRRLVACWSEKHRHYHTLQHLRECFEHLVAARPDMQRPAEVAMALWFHDAIYEPARDDNEKRSADWAGETLLRAGVPEAAAQRVYDMVMATLGHAPQADSDAQLLVDIDLSIFGADAARFDESNEQIHREYAHVPEDQWRVGRKRVLRGFLDRPRLYCTDRFHGLLGERAKQNITRALALLES
jgi:predicted metal-dependent HD superfamily phosphohydrolase